MEKPVRADILADPILMARLFHDIYEHLAPQFGYETRQETRRFDEQTPNGRLMIAVCGEIQKLLQPQKSDIVITITGCCRCHG